MSVPGIFTKVQEIIRLFTVSDCITVGVVCVCVPGGDEDGWRDMSTAEQVLYSRLEA